MRKVRKDENSQLVLVGGVAMAFAIIMLASLSLLSTKMDADRDIEPTLDQDFKLSKNQFEKALKYNYNNTNDSAGKVFNRTSKIFEVMQMQYGIHLQFKIETLQGNNENITLSYSIVMQSQEQYLQEHGSVNLIR